MATPKRSALGRGLDALISMDNIVTSGTSSIHEIELSQIVPNPDQPRREFDQEALEELASSIRELGIIQPISLRQGDGGNYQIIWLSRGDIELHKWPGWKRFPPM